MFYSYYIYPDTGFEFNDSDMPEMENHLEHLMGDICDAAVEAWQDEEQRHSVAAHLLQEHELNGPGVTSFLRLMDVIHIYRQFTDNEEPYGVLYQRE